MINRRSASLRTNIITVIVLASSLAVAVFTLLITIVNTRSSISLQDSRLAVLADVIGQNSMAALDFSDHRAAGEVLAALRREAAIVSACLYDAHGNVFSEYWREARSASCPKQLPAASAGKSSYRRVIRNIGSGTEFVGWIEVTADMRDLKDRNSHILAIAILLALISVTMAACSGAVLQRRISKPVIQLAAAMNRITKEASFEARVAVQGATEIAQLAAGFNRMVAELERRNQIARAAESQLLEQARTDELTGLPNRRYLLEKLPRDLERARQKGWTVGLLYIDLDGFKLVNDSLGHHVGDLLLRAVANRLRSRVRLVDTLARVGGDEFTVILIGIQSANDAMVAANGLIQSLSPPFEIDGNQITVGASMGISTHAATDADDPDLLKQADSAMYAAKRRGKNRAVHFSPELGLMARERLTIESELRGAVGRGEIFVEYQPEFNAVTGHLLRFEALARWNHPNLGSIPPDTFIPIAEESGLIYGIGEFVMERACRDCVEWQKYSCAPIEVAVNISAIQFNSEMLVEEVATVLRRTGLPANLLQLELTESVMIGSLSHSAEKMMRLRSLGVTLAIDDFGTGYSCLGYLPRLPFSALKIDRTFVRNLRSSPEGATMIQSMIDLGKKMGLRVIAEGIEDQSQFSALVEMGADEVQGFLFGMPSSNPIAQYGTHLRGSRNRSNDGLQLSFEVA